MKVITLDPSRRDSTALLRKSRLFVSGVIPAKNSPRPSVRLSARVDGAVLRISHSPDWKPAA